MPVIFLIAIITTYFMVTVVKSAYMAAGSSCPCGRPCVAGYCPGKWSGCSADLPRGRNPSLQRHTSCFRARIILY